MTGTISPTLILLYGANCNGRMWDAIRRGLDPAFHVLAPDLPGHGAPPGDIHLTGRNRYRGVERRCDRRYAGDAAGAIRWADGSGSGALLAGQVVDPLPPAAMEFSVFATNSLSKQYYDSYIDSSCLTRRAAGLHRLGFWR